MKNQLQLGLTVILMMCVLTSFSAITGDGEKKASIDWKEKIHDFGKVPVGIPAKTVFEFTNNTDAPVIISKVKASCGCTSTNYTKTPINPGEKGSIDVSYNAKSKGNFNKSISVTLSNQTELIRLMVKGEVVPEQATD